MVKPTYILCYMLSEHCCGFLNSVNPPAAKHLLSRKMDKIIHNLQFQIIENAYFGVRSKFVHLK